MKHRVTCKNCGKSDDVEITTNGVILWSDNKHIISGRKRLDSQWGWQCVCGNNDIMSHQELTGITDKANPDPDEIAAIVSNIRKEPSRFTMN